MEKQERMTVTLRMPVELHQQLKIRAAIEGTTLSDIAERVIGEYLRRKGVK